MSIDIGRRVAKHDYGDLFAPYTGVTINLQDGDASFTAGDDSGRTLTVESPWASQKMADNLLAQVRGARHQPFNATGAILDPAAELAMPSLLTVLPVLCTAAASGSERCIGLIFLLPEMRKSIMKSRTTRR